MLFYEVIKDHLTCILPVLENKHIIKPYKGIVQLIMYNTESKKICNYCTHYYESHKIYTLSLQCINRSMHIVVILLLLPVLE